MKKSIFKKTIAFLLVFTMYMGMLPGFDFGIKKVYATADPNDSRTKFDTIFFGKTDYNSSTSVPGNDYVIWPRGLAKDSLGNFYTAEMWDSSSRVHKISPTGTHVKVWGTKGSSNGQFVSPTGIAVDSSDNIYVTELNGHRIQKFKSDGTFLASFNSWGAYPNQLSSPNGVAIDSTGAVYVANTGVKSIVKLTSNLTYDKSWKCGDSPSTIFVDKSNNKIYVGEQYSPKVYIYDTNGISKGSFNTESNVTAIYVDPLGNIYIGGMDNKIYKYGSDYSLKYSWSPQQGIPYGFEMDNKGDIYVALGDKIVKSSLASLNNNLSSLTIDGQALNPIFNKATTDYTVNVSESTTSITLTPTVEDSTAKIKINDVYHKSGTAKEIAIGLGDNPIKIGVTSDNGDEKFYNVTVKAAIPPDQVVAKLMDGGYYYNAPGDNTLYIGDNAESSLKFNLTGITAPILEAWLNVKTNKDFSNITVAPQFNYNLYGSNDDSWTVGYANPISRDVIISEGNLDYRIPDYWKRFDVKDFVTMQRDTNDKLCSFVVSSPSVGDYMCINGLSSPFADVPYLYIRIPAIDKRMVGFDKNIAKASDIPIKIIVADVLSNIKSGNTTLVKDVDYTVSGDTITLKKEYLKTLPVGKTDFIVNLGKCTPQILSVNVVDTAPANSTISPQTGSFDKKISTQANLVTTMNLNGNNLISITNGQTSLVRGTDYEVNGNEVTIKKEYLAKQEVGTTNLTFNFSAGDSQNLSVKVEKHCTVTFKDYDGTVIGSEQNIEYGNVALAPSDPIRVGYSFTGWDKTFNNVTEDLIVTAKYDINHYKVIFKDWDGKQLGNEQNIEYKKSAVAPIAPTRLGYGFIGWDREFNNVTEDLIVISMYGINHCTVTFKDYNGNLMGTSQIIEYGKSAIAPAAPGKEGYTFIGWDKNFNNIIQDLEITAKYEINNYKVTFRDYDGKIIESTQIIDHGKAAIAPTAPSKNGYSFIVWDKDFDNVTEDLEVTAKYNINHYKVIFKDWDGKEIGTEQSVEYGKSAVAPSEPTRVGYGFTCWDKKFDNITEDLEVTAKYDINHYKVTFKDWDGKGIGTEQSIEYGKSAVAPSEPTRVGYGFTGWNKKFDNITENLEVTARYDINHYKVTFKDWDGKEIGTEQSIDYGKSAVEPSDLKREGYGFIGWDKDFTNITQDLTVNAKYKINHYKVTFKDYDGTIISTQENIEYGKSAIVPSKPSRVGYTFTGWDKTYNNVTEDLIVTARYEINHYKVTFKDYDGKEIGTYQSIEYGKSAVAPTEPTRLGYSFVGWDKDFNNVTKELEVKAMYGINHCKVTFKDYDGNVIGMTQTVEYGQSITAPKAPTKEGYTFTCWDKNFNIITEDLEVRAKYDINHYKVMFKDYNGREIGNEQIVEYGKSAIPPTAPAKEGYNFIVWDKAFNVVKEELVVNAIYGINHYTIKFKDYNRDLVGAEQRIEYGQAAVAPKVPSKEGYTFIEWDKTFNNITEDLEVTAKYEINHYKVNFRDYDGKIIESTQIIDHAKAAIAPKAPNKEGYSFVGWDKTFNNVIGDLDVKVLYEINHYKVTFKDHNGNLIGNEQSVEYGKSAVEPTEPTRIGYKFSTWDKDFNNITSDLVVIAKYTTGITYTMTAKENKDSKEVKCDIGYFTSGKNNIVVNNEISSLIVPANIIDSADMQGIDYIKVLQTKVDEKSSQTLLENLPSDIKAKKILDLKIQLFDYKDTFIKDIHQFSNNNKVKIGIKLTSDDIKNIDTDNLSMYYYDEDKKEWMELGGIFDKDSMEFVYYTPHFTKFAIMEKQRTVLSENKDKINTLIQTGSPIGFDHLFILSGLFVLVGVFIIRRRK